MKVWVIVNRTGHILPWAGAFSLRRDAWKAAARGLMSAGDYEDHDAAWHKRYLKRNGVRVKRATLKLL